MKPSPIAVAIFLVCPFLTPTLMAQTPAAANQSAASPAPSASAAEVPRLIKFSGMLLDAQDRPMAGPVGVTFALHAQQTGGAALWMETQNVTPDARGVYTVLLGANSANGVPAELFASGEARWLEVQVEQQAEQPRVLLVSVPYALKAGDAQTLGGKPASAFLTTETLAATSNSGAATSSNASAALLSAHSATTPKSAAATKPKSAGALAAISGTGTANFIAKFKDAADIQNSAIFESGGNVSIGTTSGNSPLTVTAGSAPLPVVLGLPTVAKFASPSGTVPWGLKQNAASSSTPTLMWFETADGPVGFMGAGGTNIFRISGFTGDALALGTNAKTQVLIDTSGNVGIGTTTPSAKLEIAGGNLALPNTSSGGSAGVVTFGGVPFLHNSGTSNTFLGAGAGNFNMAGGFNTATGMGALQNNISGGTNTASGVDALFSNMGGGSNTASGVNALFSNTSGFNNTASGQSALFANTIGNDNTASGLGALGSNTTGLQNTASGESALGSNTTGSGNTAIGFLAGSTSAPARANTTGFFNTFIGFQAGPGTPTQLTNATAIGANAAVTCSNCVVLGDSTLPMNVGIRTNSPGQALSVAGTIQSTTGGFLFPDGTTQTTAVAGGNVTQILYTGEKTATSSSTPVLLLTVGTFSKVSAATAITATWISHVRGGTGGGIDFCQYELRIDNTVPTGTTAGLGGAVVFAEDQAVTLTGRWTGLASGSHTVSIWLRGSGLSCTENPGPGPLPSTTTFQSQVYVVES